LRVSGDEPLNEIDLVELGVADRPRDPIVVSFGHPWCTDCQALEAEVVASGWRL
jgi:hypothetical protein